MEHASQTSGAKSATFQMRINQEVKKEAEELFAAYGLTLTDAVNVFLRQLLNTGGLPFLLSPENAEYIKAKAMKQMLTEAEKGWQSAEAEGWVSLDEAEARLGIAHE